MLENSAFALPRHAAPEVFRPPQILIQSPRIGLRESRSAWQNLLAVPVSACAAIVLASKHRFAAARKRTRHERGIVKQLRALSAPLDTSEVDSVKIPSTPLPNVFEEFSHIARQLGESGVDLGQGFPNYDPPEFVVEALRSQLDGQCWNEETPSVGHQYSRTSGDLPLVNILAKRYSGHLQREIDPLREVAITAGATGGLYLALRAALSRASALSPPCSPAPKEVVVLEPFFELYRSQVKALGGIFRSVPLEFDLESRSFSLDVKSLRATVGSQTAALIVNTPHNPSGKAFTEQELMAIAEIARDHPHVCVISDEVYKYMIFDPPDAQTSEDPTRTSDKPAGHVHMAALPGMWDQTVTISSAGKTFGITGWQIGWVVGDRRWLEPIQSYMPNLQFCAPTLMQRALVKVFETACEPCRGAPSYYEWLRQMYVRRRNVMIAALEEVGIQTAASQAGLFVLGDVSALCGPDGPLGDSWEASLRPGEPQDWTFCRALASKLGIVALPVSPFFDENGLPYHVRSRFVRFCFAKTDGTLMEAARRLRSLSAK